MNDDEVFWNSFSENLTVDYRTVSRLRPTMNFGTEGMTCLRMFKKMMPTAWFQGACIGATSDKLEGANEKRLSEKEWFVWLGIWLCMTLNPAYKIADFFSMRSRDTLFTCPYLGQFMSGKRFAIVNSCMCITTREPPTTYRDKFWEIREMCEAFNEHMDTFFSPGTQTCIDESMVAFLARWACPGWVNVKRKPHPFGNEYHIIADVETKIIFGVEIVETKKDAPTEGPYAKKLFEDEMSKIASLCVRLAKPIWGSGRIVGLDSGFGGIPAVLELKKKGLFANAQMKKKAGWPAKTKASEMIDELAGKPVGTVRVREGRIGEHKLFTAGLADSKHVSIMINTCGTTIRTGKNKRRRIAGAIVEFKYPVYALQYYRARHAVDDNNNNRQGRLSFEETYLPQGWEKRQFGFILSLILTNSFLACNFFLSHGKLSKSSFMQELMRETLFGTDEKKVAKKRVSKRNKFQQEQGQECEVLDEHFHRRIHKGYGKWRNGLFRKAKSDYPRFKCSGKCGNRTRMYCTCDPCAILCERCFACHLAEVFDTRPN